MSKEWTPKELLLDLVSVQSDTYTTLEIDMAKHILEVIKGQDYWEEHPDCCGLYDGMTGWGVSFPGRFEKEHPTGVWFSQVTLTASKSIAMIR